MQSVFISSDESSSYIDSNESISDSNNSSTSYVPVADNFSEEYTNQVGGTGVVKTVGNVIENITDGAKKLYENTIPEEAREAIEKTTEQVSNVVVETTKNIGDGANKIYENTVPEETREAIKETTDQVSKVVAKTTEQVGEVVTKTTEQVGEVVAKTTEQVGEVVTKTTKQINQQGGGLEKLSKIEIIEKYNELINQINKEKNLKQLGGSYNPKKAKKYYEKYIKYKLKYLELKYD